MQDNLLAETGSCPFCGAPMAAFHKDGHYERDFICYEAGTPVYHRITIHCVECSSCGHSHALEGKCERNFRTLRNRFLNVLDMEQIAGIEQLNEKLHAYIQQHNTTVHSSTGMTPQDRYMADILHIKMPSDREWLENCFMNRIKRLVRNDATVTIDKTLYDVPMEFIRSKVEIRYLPDAMEKAYIWYEEKKYPIRKTNKIENGKTKRNNEYAINYGGTNDV